MVRLTEAVWSTYSILLSPSGFGVVGNGLERPIDAVDTDWLHENSDLIQTVGARIGAMDATANDCVETPLRWATKMLRSTPGQNAVLLHGRRGAVTALGSFCAHKTGPSPVAVVKKPISAGNAPDPTAPEPSAPQVASTSRIFS